MPLVSFTHTDRSIRSLHRVSATEGSLRTRCVRRRYSFLFICSKIMRGGSVMQFFKYWATTAIISAGFLSCATSPTGRKQLHLLPDDQMNQLGAQAFTEMKKQVQPNGEPGPNGTVRCVAEAI